MQGRATPHTQTHTYVTHRWKEYAQTHSVNSSISYAVIFLAVSSEAFLYLSLQADYLIMKQIKRWGISEHIICW